MAACPGRWCGVISAGFTGDGKRIRRYASAQTRAAVTDKLRQLQADVTAGAKPPRPPTTPSAPQSAVGTR